MKGNGTFRGYHLHSRNCTERCLNTLSSDPNTSLLVKAGTAFCAAQLHCRRAGVRRLLRRTWHVILRILSIAGTFLIITFLLLLSLEIPVNVEDRAELGSMRLGYPLHFVVQDNTSLSIGEPDSAPFPQPLGAGNFLDNPMRVLPFPLLGNYLLVYGALFLLTHSLRRRHRRGQD